MTPGVQLSGIKRYFQCTVSVLAFAACFYPTCAYGQIVCTDEMTLTESPVCSHSGQTVLDIIEDSHGLCSYIPTPQSCISDITAVFWSITPTPRSVHGFCSYEYTDGGITADLFIDKITSCKNKKLRRILRLNFKNKRIIPF